MHVERQGADPAAILRRVLQGGIVADRESDKGSPVLNKVAERIGAALGSVAARAESSKEQAAGVLASAEGALASGAETLTGLRRKIIARKVATVIVARKLAARVRAEAKNATVQPAKAAKKTRRKIKAGIRRVKRTAKRAARRVKRSAATTRVKARVQARKPKRRVKK